MAKHTTAYNRLVTIAVAFGSLTYGYCASVIGSRVRNESRDDIFDESLYRQESPRTKSTDEDSLQGEESFVSISTPSGNKDKGKAREVAADAIRDNAKRQRRYIPVDQTEDTAAIGYDDDDEELCIRGEFSDFDNAVGEEVGGFLFGLAQKDLDDDLRARIDDIASRCITKDGVAMPFMPMTEEGKAVFSVEGLMTFESFNAKYTMEPIALYNEIKLRAIIMAARYYYPSLRCRTRARTRGDDVANRHTRPRNRYP
ncbi:hypothetical protein GE09DRAFT_1294736 [Coniochaeta sp. 2T2.1]|nr:hypothetical protein GE09DRAFT_1294736 [Coniochaeta sp. 2T2.1]